MNVRPLGYAPGPRAQPPSLGTREQSGPIFHLISSLLTRVNSGWKITVFMENYFLILFTLGCWVALCPLAEL